MPKTIFVRKPISLGEVKSGTEECKRLFDSKGADYYVAEERQLSNRDWQEFTSSLLADRDWIKAFSEKNYPETESGTPCIRVATPGSEIALIIDTQGYDYARYVGIEDASFEIEEDEDDEDSFEIEVEDEPAENLDETAVQEAIWGMLAGEWDVDNSLLRGCHARTYSEAGTLTYNKGLVVTMPDGCEFQITIVKSR